MFLQKTEGFPDDFASRVVAARLNLGVDISRGLVPSRCGKRVSLRNGGTISRVFGRTCRRVTSRLRTARPRPGRAAIALWSIGLLAGCTKALYTKSMRALNVSEFRKQCLALLDELPAEGIVVTKRGEPIARVLPIRQDNGDLIGSLAGAFEIKGDILSTGEQWDAQS